MKPDRRKGLGAETLTGIHLRSEILKTHRRVFMCDPQNAKNHNMPRSAAKRKLQPCIRVGRAASNPLGACQFTSLFHFEPQLFEKPIVL